MIDSRKQLMRMEGRVVARSLFENVGRSVKSTPLTVRSVNSMPLIGRSVNSMPLIGRSEREQQILQTLLPHDEEAPGSPILLVVFRNTLCLQISK